MNTKNIIHLTNKIAITFIVILIYWVFIFSVVEIFDFKIFRRNMSQAFGLSILGILAILLGSIILNVMLNLTRIADNHQGEVTQSKYPLKWFAIGICAFPVLFSLLFLGDKASKAKKERQLVNAATLLVDEKQSIIQALVPYEFNRAYLHQTAKNIQLLGKTDKHFPNITVLVKDAINSEPVILSVGQYDTRYDAQPAQKPLNKIDYIYPTTADEREYLLHALDGKTHEPRYEAHKGSYKLYYPLTQQGQSLVILLSDYLPYGKYGS